MNHVLFSKAGVATQIVLDNILVDVGDGTLRDLLAAEYDLEDLDIIVITHGHYDHMGGLQSLLGYLRMIGRTSLLTIVHPGACEVDALIAGFHKCYKGTIPYQIKVVHAEDRKMYTFDSAKIQPFFVQHAGSTAQGVLSPIPAAGYRIYKDDKIYAVTGDSGMCEPLKILISGADTAFIEATWTKERKEKLTKKYGDIEEDMLTVHLSEEQAHELGRLAKNYVIIHM
ncbi:MAG: MBL fold metallo-hydrolase [Candidatus Methanofastidiosia archaeon]|jgi:ribonuclease Z